MMMSEDPGCIAAILVRNMKDVHVVSSIFAIRSLRKDDVSKCQGEWAEVSRPDKGLYQDAELCIVSGDGRAPAVWDCNGSFDLQLRVLGVLPTMLLS
jgi:hypothetical protein